MSFEEKHNHARKQALEAAEDKYKECMKADDHGGAINEQDIEPGVRENLASPTKSPSPRPQASRCVRMTVLFLVQRMHCACSVTQQVVHNSQSACGTEDAEPLTVVSDLC